jgi:thioesterase domain-containing protein/aryl carrier-like protein
LAALERDESFPAEAPPYSGVEAQLVHIFESLLGVHPVGVTDNFFDLGGDSILAARLVEEVMQIWGVDLSVVCLYDAPTAKQFAALLREGNLPRFPPRVNAIKPEGSRPPFLCIDGGFYLRRLAQRLNKDQPLLGLRLEDVEKLPAHYTVSDIAAYHLETIRAVQPHGPYYLGGWSASGVVAYEVAQQLRRSGEQVALLVLFDTRNEAYARQRSALEAFRSRLRSSLSKLKYHARNLRSLAMRERRFYLADLFRQSQINAKRVLWIVEDRIQRRSRRLKLPPLEANQAVFIAARKYQPAHYAGRVLLFRCAAHPVEFDRSGKLGWGGLLKGKLEIVETPGDHQHMFREPYVATLGVELDRRLLEAEEHFAE